MKKLLLLLIFSLTPIAGFAPEFRTIPIKESGAILYLDWQDIEILMHKYQIMHPAIVRSQIILETGWLKSDLYRLNKNLFGMRYAPLRETTAIGSQNNHALYSSYEDCIRDYKLWQDLYYSGGDYYAFLHQIGYAEDKGYITKLKNIVK
jgi:flagellum-specific peptidoglycan hydrolase FlgJ